MMRPSCTAMLLAAVLLTAGCQSMLPKAQGLATAQWQARDYQRQDQLEIQWNNHSFSFLLYQQQSGEQLQMLALSLTGQQLFKLQFDGKQVKVEQRIEAMRLLPFDFLVRDILFASDPQFAQMSHDQVQVLNTTHGQQVHIQQKLVLQINKSTEHIELNNLQVPYQMVISAVAADSLQPLE